MYEIWLAMNIAWEIALDIWPLLLVAAFVWLTLVGTAWRQGGRHWRAGLWPAVGVGGVFAIVAVLIIPGWTRSSLPDMGYWLDWVVLLGLAPACESGGRPPSSPFPSPSSIQASHENRARRGLSRRHNRVARLHPGIKPTGDRRHVEIAHGLHGGGRHGCAAAGLAVEQHVQVAPVAYSSGSRISMITSAKTTGRTQVSR